MSDLTLIHNENGEKYLKEVSKAHYAFLNNDATTETLREELSLLWSEMGNLTSIEEPTEEDTAAIKRSRLR